MGTGTAGLGFVAVHLGDDVPRAAMSLKSACTDGSSTCRNWLAIAGPNLSTRPVSGLQACIRSIYCGRVRLASNSLLISMLNNFIIKSKCMIPQSVGFCSSPLVREVLGCGTDDGWAAGNGLLQSRIA